MSSFFEYLKDINVGDVLFCIVSLFLLYFGVEIFMKIMGHLSGIAETMIFCGIKIALVLALLAMIYPVTHSIKMSPAAIIANDETVSSLSDTVKSYALGWFLKV